uniref:Cytochrome P450 87A3 n=1 Tax=Cajanus cajan TaxID=3821 RepID=A0A151UFH8_CAJCA
MNVCRIYHKDINNLILSVIHFSFPPFIKQRMKRYGPIFKTNLVGRPVVVSTDPDHNYFIFQQEGQVFQSWYPETFTEIFGRQNVGSLHGFMYKYLKNMVLEEHEAIIKRREDPNSGVTWKEYKSMTFTFQVINETVRLANIVPGIFRKALREINFKGYTIAKGWAVIQFNARKKH